MKNACPNKVIYLTLKLVFALLLCCSCTTHADNVLTPYTLHYETQVKGFKLKAERSLALGKNGYELKQSTLSSVLKTFETSLFSLQKGQFISQHYYIERRFFGNSQIRENNFYAEKNTASYILEDDEPVIIKTPAIIYDTLNYQEKMRLEFLQWGKLKTTQYPILDKERVRKYEFTSTENEILNTAIGPLETVKIERVRKDSKKQTTVWLAKNWGFVIVRILHREPGESDYQLNIASGSLNNIAIKADKIN